MQGWYYLLTQLVKIHRQAQLVRFFVNGLRLRSQETASGASRDCQG